MPPKNKAQRAYQPVSTDPPYPEGADQLVLGLYATVQRIVGKLEMVDEEYTRVLSRVDELFEQLFEQRVSEERLKTLIEGLTTGCKKRGDSIDSLKAQMIRMEQVAALVEDKVTGVTALNKKIDGLSLKLAAILSGLVLVLTLGLNALLKWLL